TARPNKRAFGNAGSVKKIFKMTRTKRKKGCWGQTAVLLYGVSLEARSTTYCSNRLPASTALFGEPLTARERQSRTRKGGLCAPASRRSATTDRNSLTVFDL